MSDPIPTNVKQDKPKVWMTDIKYRRPQVKTYTNIGHAKSAVTYHAPGRYTGQYRIADPNFFARVFELKDGEWVYRRDLSWEHGDPLR